MSTEPPRGPYIKLRSEFADGETSGQGLPTSPQYIDADTVGRIRLSNIIFLL